MGFPDGQSLPELHPTQVFAPVLQTWPELLQVLVQLTVVPQLLVAEPHALPEQAVVLSAVQPHEFAPTPPPPQVFTPVQVFGQVMAVPQLLVAGPQALPVHAAVLLGVHPQAFAPAPPPPHVLAPVQVLGQVMAAPQLLVAGPQALPMHAAVLLAVQPHPFGPAEPPPQVFGDVHVLGHMIVWPQLLVAGPQALPMHAAVLSGMHWQVVVGDPEHVSLVAQAVHFAVSPQPLLASVGTHLEPHFLVPAPQVPTMQVVPWQTSVSLPETAGQLVASQVVAPQP